MVSESEIETSLELDLSEQPINILNKHPKINVCEQFVHRIRKESKNVNKKAKRSCKVLYFSSECKFEDILATLVGLNANTYPNLFIFIIELKHDEYLLSKEKAEEILKDKILKFGKTRPLILQLTSNSKTSLYYKEDSSTQFCFIGGEQRDFKETRDFPSLLYSFLNQQLVKFEDDFLEVLPQIRYSSLILKFLRTLNLTDEFIEKIILDVSKRGTKKAFLSSLDAQFNADGLVLNFEAQKYLSQVFDRGSSVLFTAIQSQNTEAINYLVTFCTHLIQQLPFEHQVLISTTAFETNQLDILCDLIEIVDFPFQNNFTADSFDHSRLSELIENRNVFKIAIEDEDIKELDKFIDNSLGNKKVYSTDNIPAIDYAFQSRKFVSYYYLKAVGFEGKIDADLDEISDEEQEKAEDEAFNQKDKNVKEALRDVHKSAMILSSRSLIHDRRISTDQEMRYRKYIRKWFEDINKIKSGHELLNVAASCERLKIVFDFERIDVERIDLLSDFHGKTYNTDVANIFIGAKLSDKMREQQIKGTLAHELCHYVMYLVYENHFLPYYKYESKIRMIFDEIVKALDKWSADDSECPNDECNNIISLVYTAYESEQFSLELIVRAVHILTEFDYDEAKTKYLQEKYKDLFDFWFKYIVPELCRFNLETRKTIQKLNKYIGLLPNIAKKSIKVAQSKDKAQLFDNKFITVHTNSPTLFLVDHYKYLDDRYERLLDCQNLFVEPEKLSNRKIRSEIKQVSTKSNHLNVWIDCTKKVPDGLKNILQENVLHYVFIVSKTSQSEEIAKILNKTKMGNLTNVELYYSWNDLEKESQKKLYQIKINFQNSSQHSFKDLIHNETLQDAQLSDNLSELIDDQLLNLLLDNSKIEINSPSEGETTFDMLYQSRVFLKKYKSIAPKRRSMHPFITSDSESDEPKGFIGSFLNIFRRKKVKSPTRNDIEQEEVQFFNDKEISPEELLVQEVLNMKYVIISDIAGNGKSWALKRIAKILVDLNSKKWVTYVDLKKFISEFKAQNENLDFAAFISEKVLKLENKFEAKLFQILYKNGKVFILFDGYDEISPNCSEFVSKLAKSFEFNGGNQLWIATRDHYEVHLTNLLDIDIIFSLDNLTKQDEIRLIVYTWLLRDFSAETSLKTDLNAKKFEEFIDNATDDKIEKYLKKAQQIADKVALSKYRSFGLPQLLWMIANEFKETDNVEDLEESKIYIKFVQKIYSNWADEKGKLRKDASVKSQEYEYNFWKFHHYIAIASLFPKYVEDLFPRYDGKEWPEEEIIACSMLAKNDKTFVFVHETFREFFVADFIAKAINRNKIEGRTFDLFVEVLKNTEFHNIRMFLNDAIDDFKIFDNNLLQKKALIICVENFRLYFFENLDKLAEFAFQILKQCSYKKVNNMLNSNAWDIAAYTDDPKMFWKFQEFLFDFLKITDLKSLIIKQKVFHGIIGSRLDVEIFEEFVKKVEALTDRQFIKKALKTDCSKELDENIFHLLSMSLNFDNHKYQVFIRVMQTYLSNAELFELMKMRDNDGRNVLQVCINRKRKLNLKVLWTETEKFFKDQASIASFKEFIYQTDHHDQNILHTAVWCNEIDVHETLWELLLELFTEREELKDLILKKDQHDKNFFHKLVSQIHNTPIIDLAFKNLKDNFEKDQIEEILSSRGENEMNMLQSAVLRSTPIEMHKFLWKLFKEMHENEKDFLKLLSEVDENGSNILNLAVGNSTYDVFEYILEEIVKIASKNEIREMLMNCGEDDRNLLQSAAYENFSSKLHKTLWKTLREYFTSSEILEFIKHEDAFGENVLFYVVSWNLKKIVEITWNEIKSFMNNDEQAEYLKTKIKGDRNIEIASYENYRGKDEIRVLVHNMLKEYQIKF